MIKYTPDIGAAPAAAEGRDSTQPLDISERLRTVLSEVLKIATVDVDADFFNDLGADSMIMARFCARVRKQSDLPSVSMRDIYANSTIRDLSEALAPAATPSSVIVGESHALEVSLAEVLAETLKIDRVDADADFFQALGADSMVMARFCARLRKRDDLPKISMKEVYANPTIRRLAAAAAPASSAGAEAAETAAHQPAPVRVEIAEPIETWRYVLCGMLQFATGGAFVVVGAAVAVETFSWVVAGSSYLDLYLRSLVATTALLLLSILMPIFAKLLLIGSWTPRKIRIWSLDYYRFWLVKTLVQANPLVLFPTPIYVMYLRLLGAKIGRNVLIVGHRVPVCTDLLTIGDNAVIRKDSYIHCYRATAGWIETGSVTIGADAIVGELTVLEIHTTVGDGAQIGHSSSLPAGHSIPPGEHWCGTPARKTNVEQGRIEPRPCGALRRTIYCLTTLLPPFLLAPAAIAVLIEVLVWIAGRHHVIVDGVVTHASSHVSFYLEALLVSTILFGLGLLGGLVTVTTIPRLLNLALRPGKAYPLYGFHYWVQGMIAALTNSRFFMTLFGDSSYVVYYLQAIGYDLSKVVQTGSNFGIDIKHDNPFLVTIGSGTVAADGLSLINADYSSSSFKLSRVAIGGQSFLGNDVAYPAGGRTGENCLLGTRVMVPIDGAVRENTGLLGSPSFEIPRTVLRDSQLSEDLGSDHVRHQLKRKNRYNIATMGLFLAVIWGESALVLLLTFAAVHAFPIHGGLAIAAPLTALPFLSFFYHAFVERASTHFRPLTPRSVSIYDPYFWFHERYWKLLVKTQHLPFNGTPLKGLIWRLLGARVGRRLFDDGCTILESTMVSIGNDCTFNFRSIIQPHSQEDGSFKSDYISIGSDCTLDVASWVHYGTVVEDGVQLGPNAFLMKGEQAPAYTRWAENPARQVARIDAFKSKRPIPVIVQPRLA